MQLDIVSDEVTLTKLGRIANGEVTLDVIKSDDFGEVYPLLAKSVDYLSAIKDTIDGKMKEAIKAQYLVDGTRAIDHPDFKIIFVPGRVGSRFDTTKFKTDHPDLYEEYQASSLRSDSLRITFAKKGE